jgi:DNA polymerase-3 subunit alpha
MAESGGRISELAAMARRVEGMPRHASTHAAGVVIAPSPLTDYVPLQEGTGGIPLTQYSMEHLEAVGLLKMDFLGLRTLSIIERTLAWVREETGQEFRWEDVSYTDEATLALMGRGDTTGVFQLESAGMRRVLKELKPSSFEDIISVLALYRPGPMEFIPQFIRTKHGEAKVEYPHPSLEPILKDTYGIIVYQEQIMQIASKMAGFSLGQADLLRRAVGKKKREILDEQRRYFVEGSLRQGYSEAEANYVYDMIVRFADYGFPRAHAAAYAVLAFQTAYLKAHYPVQFMASMLTSVIGNQRKTAEYVDECRHMGISVLPPDINESGVLFTPSGGAIRFGLAAIKNVGTQAIENILKERRERKFDSLGDLCRRVDPRVCNKRVLESLILAGALESLPGHRAQQYAALDEAVDLAAKWRKEREELQIELFDFGDSPNWEVELPDVPPMTAAQTLELERELLGLYLSGHPLDEFDGIWDELGLARLVDLAEAADGSSVLTAGMIVSVKPFLTRKGQSMAFLEIEDRIMSVELVAFPSVWKTASAFVEKGSLVLVRAKVQHSDEDFKLLADDFVPLGAPDLRQQAARLRRLAGVSGGPARMPSVASAPSRSSVPTGMASGTQPGNASGVSPGMQSGDAFGVSPDMKPSEPAAGASYASSGMPSGVISSASLRELADVSPDISANMHQRARLRESMDMTSGDSSVVQSSAPSRLPAGTIRNNSSGTVAANDSGDGRGNRLRAYIRIAEAHERRDVLVRLKRLLSAYPGEVTTVLFYERGRRTVALSDDLRIHPSEELFEQVNKLLGEGSIRVK